MHEQLYKIFRDMGEIRNTFSYKGFKINMYDTIKQAEIVEDNKIYLLDKINAMRSILDAPRHNLKVIFLCVLLEQIKKYEQDQFKKTVKTINFMQQKLAV